MAGERIISQNSGLPLGVLEGASIGGAYFGGSVTGDTPSIPQISASVRTSDDQNPLFFQNEPAVLDLGDRHNADGQYARGERHYGTVKNVDTSTGRNTASLAVDPILSKLNQEITTFPAWGSYKTAVAGYISQIMNSCGITRWAIPGVLLNSFEFGGSNIRSPQSNDIYEWSTFSSLNKWQIGAFTTGNFGAQASFQDTTQILFTMDESVKVGDYSEVRFSHVSEQGEGDEATVEQYDVAAFRVTLFSKVSNQNVDTYTFRVQDLEYNRYYVSVVEAYPILGQSKTVRLNLKITDNGLSRRLKRDIAIVSGTYGDVEGSQSSYGTYDIPMPVGAMRVKSVLSSPSISTYIYNKSGDGFSVTNGVDVYPYSVVFGSGAPTAQVGIPGATGSGWSVLSDFMLVYGLKLDAVAGTFTHKSVPTGMPKTPREMSYLAGPLSMSSSAREVRSRCNISDYRYKVNTANQILYVAHDSLSVNAGETSRVVVDLEDGTSVASLAQPTVQTPESMQNIKNGSLSIRSGYSVIRSNGWPVDGSAWTANGGSVRVRLGETSNQIVITITGPAKRLYPGNDEEDNGTYTLSSAPNTSDEYALVIVGKGIVADKRVVQTWTGGQEQQAKVTPVDYDNKFVSGSDALWTTAQMLADAYGSDEVTASGSLSAPNASVAFNAERPSADLRVGSMLLRLEEYTRQPGGASFSSAVVGTTVGAVDTFFAGKTCAEVTTIKSDYRCSDDAIQPFGKDLV